MRQCLVLLRIGRGIPFGLSLPRQTTQIPDHFRQVLALDQSHGIVVNSPLTSDRVDRHNVLVLQLRRRARLVQKPLQTTCIKHTRERQHFDRHTFAERDLSSFIDDAHPAAPNLASQAIVAQRTRHSGAKLAARRLTRQISQQPHPRMQQTQLVGMFRVPIDQLVQFVRVASLDVLHHTGHKFRKTMMLGRARFDQHRTGPHHMIRGSLRSSDGGIVEKTSILRDQINANASSTRCVASGNRS